MSTRTVVFSLNDAVIDIKSPQTAALLEVLTMIKDPTADTIQHALDAKDDQGRAYRTFYPQQFAYRDATDENGDPIRLEKDMTDTFHVFITHDDGRTFSGKATRQVLVNRLTVACNVSEYTPTIVKHVPTTAEGKPAKASTKVSADDI